MEATLMSVLMTVYSAAALFVIRAAYCRLRHTSKRTLPAVRANYAMAAAGHVIALGALLLAGLGELPRAEAVAIGLCAVSLSSAIGFALSAPRWRGKVPPETERPHAPAVFPWERT